MVQVWATVRPCLRSVYLASTSPVMADDLESWEPATLKVTSEGVLVLTSREVPWKG